MAAMITTGAQQQGKNAIDRHPAPVTYDDDYNPIIQELLDHSYEKFQRGEVFSLEDTFHRINRQMGWDEAFYQSDERLMRNKAKIEGYLKEMRNYTEGGYGEGEEVTTTDR